MSVAIALFLPQLVAAAPQAWVGQVSADDVRAEGPVSGQTIAASLNRHLDEARSCYADELALGNQRAHKQWLTWSIEAEGRVRFAQQGNDRLERCLLNRIATLTFPSEGGTTTVSQPFVFNTVGNWLADPVVRGVRQATDRLDAALDGGVPAEQQTCRLFMPPDGMGWRFVGARRVDEAHPALGSKSTIVIDDASLGMSDDIASTRTLVEYRTVKGEVVFRYDESAQSRALAPARSQTRSYWVAGRHHLTASRSGPSADRIWWEEETGTDLTPAPAADTLWAAFRGTDADECAELRTFFEKAEKRVLNAAARARAKKRFGARVVFGAAPDRL